jgi:hypothetical protein
MKLEDLATESAKRRIETDFEGVIRGLSRSLETDGIAHIEGFFNPDAIERMKAYALGKLELCTKGKRTPLIGGDLEGTVFLDICRTDLIVKISNALIRRYGYRVESADIYPVLNILHGPDTQDAVRAFHFDASFLTAAIPVAMGGRSAINRGQFRIYPNVRKFSTSKVREKLYWAFMKQPLARRLVKHSFVDFEVGNLYFFYGFRSYHCTEPLDPDILRINCLLNIGGPFFDKTKKEKASRATRAP